MDEQSREADLLRRISGLLKKAEGTDNEHEAKAFFEKAHELMVRHAIDEARVRAEQRRAAGAPVTVPVVLDYMYSSYAHHATAKQDLLAAICSSHWVKSFPYSNKKDSNERRVKAAGLEGLHESQWTRLIGYVEDIDAVKMLYLSLIVQAQRFASEDWRTKYGEAKHSSREDGYVGKFSWISTHMEGFSSRIGTRFREMTGQIVGEDADVKALILDKDANINEWMYENGFAVRPKPPVFYCWTTQPESDPGWPRTAAGKPNKKWRARYCIIKLQPDPDRPNYGLPHEGPHAFTYDSGPYRSSYYVSVGRKESSEARGLGRSAADRADIGQPRVSPPSRPALKG